MSRREYDDYDRRGDRGGNVEYVPASHRQRSPPRTSGQGYGPPGGFPESPKDSYPRTTYPAPVSMPHAPVTMPHAPAPPADDENSKHPATIVSGRRPPSPGVRFADEYPSNRGPPRGS